MRIRRRSDCLRPLVVPGPLLVLYRNNCYLFHSASLDRPTQARARARAPSECVH